MPACAARVQSKSLTDPFADVIGFAYIMRKSAPPIE